jgi:purine-binding chemotaxis protein CheW
MEDEIILEGTELPPVANEGEQPAAVEPARVELPPERQYCIFRTGRDRYCMSVLEIEEVVEWPRVTTVPLAPDFLVGIFNLRGAIVPVVDVATNQGRRFDSALKKIVVGFMPAVEGHGFSRIGIAADEVIGTCTTTEEVSTEAIPHGMPHCSGLLRVGEKMALAIGLAQVAEVFPVPVF